MPGGKRRYWIAASLLLVLAGCLLLLLVNSSKESSLTQRLPDGSAVTIRQVSYGKVYRYVTTNGWRRIAGQFLPEKYSARLGIFVHSFTNTTAKAYVTLETLDASPNHYYRPFPNATNLHMMYDIVGPELIGASIELGDDAGNGFLLPKLWILGWTTPNRGVFQVPLVSHAAKFLTLQVSHYDPALQTNYSSTFVVRNPAPRSAPRWQAQPLPLTNQAGDLAVELLAIEPGTPHEFQLFGLQERTGHGTRVRLRIRQHGEPTTAWRATGVSVADEEGNVFVPHALDFPDAESIGFDGSFSPREIRKFRFELNRAPPFRPDEKSVSVTTSIASLSRIFHYASPPLGLDNGEYKLQIRSMYREKINGADELWFDYDVSPQPPADLKAQIFVQAVDQDGRDITFVRSGAPVDLNMGFKIPGSVKSDTVKIIFALTKPRFVEFLARPSPPGTNNPVAR